MAEQVGYRSELVRHQIRFAAEVLAQAVLGVVVAVSTMYYRAAASVAIPFGPEAANSQAVEPTLMGFVIVLETIAAAYERMVSDSS